MALMITFLKHTSVLSRSLLISDTLAVTVQNECIEYNGRLHHSVILELIQDRHGTECMILASYLLGQLSVPDETENKLNDLVNKVHFN